MDLGGMGRFLKSKLGNNPPADPTQNNNPMGPGEYQAISNQLGDKAYGTITKARAGYGPNLGLSPEELAQTDRYLEGTTQRDGGIVDKILGITKAGGYEAAKGLAQNVPGGRDVWNGTIGQFSDFKMDDTTSPANPENVKAYLYGMFSPNPEEDEQRKRNRMASVAPY